MEEELSDQALSERAVGLLGPLFVNHRDWLTVLNQAFEGSQYDPRPLLKTDQAPKDFAQHCVSELLSFGCIGAGKHSLARLLEVCAGYYGFDRPADYELLPALLDRRCERPPRALEVKYLEGLFASKYLTAARIYAPLDGRGKRPLIDALSPSTVACWEIRPDLCLRRKRKGEAQLETRHYDDILDAFTEFPRAVLLGAPGAGKSTTLQKLAWERALQAKGDRSAALPFYVQLGRWTDPEQTPAAFFRAELQEVSGVSEMADFLVGLCRAGRAILLLDGLNETPTLQRKAMTNALKAWLKTLPADPALYIACRKDDYQDPLRFDLDELSIEALTPPRVRHTIAHIFAGLEPPLEAAEAEMLFWELAGGESMRALLAKWQRLGADETLFWTAEDIPRRDPDIYSHTSGGEHALWRRQRDDPQSLLGLASNPYLLTLIIQQWLDREALTGKGSIDGPGRQCLGMVSEQIRRPDGHRLGW